jgi:putative ABC transport system permease protein
MRPVGRLARGNALRNPKRTASTAGALMIGMALVSGACVMASSMDASMRGLVDNELLADLVLVNESGTVPSGLVAEVEALAEARTVDVLEAMAVDVEGVDRALTLVGMDPASVARSLRVGLVEGSWADVEAGRIGVNKVAAKQVGWEIGDTLALRTPVGGVEAPVGAVFEFSGGMGSVLVNREVFAGLARAGQDSAAMVFVGRAEGVSFEALDRAVSAAAAPYLVVSAMDSEEYLTSMTDGLNTVIAVVYALLALSLAIAVLGIVNTLALSIAERTREIGLLRAVGMGRGQVAGTIALESVLIAAFGALGGMAIGVGLGACLPRLLEGQGLSVLAIPWVRLTWMFALICVTGVVAAVWPAIRATRIPVLRAVEE